jgi:hypothetical protein
LQKTAGFGHVLGVTLVGFTLRSAYNLCLFTQWLVFKTKKSIFPALALKEEHFPYLLFFLFNFGRTGSVGEADTWL